MKRSLVMALVLASTRALAQPLPDASVAADAAVVAPTSNSESGGCVTDPVPADRAPTVRVVVEPAQPKVGDRVLLRYQFRYRERDRVEFAPDLVAFQQPGSEVEFAREQPSRELRPVSDGAGWVRSEVLVAVQPFRTGEVSFGAQRARLNASDEIARLCTPPVRFRVQSPFGNTAHPVARDITEPTDVRRDALWLRHVALGLDGAFVLVLATLGVSGWMQRRPKPVVPPPPPRHPAIVAMEALDAVAHGDLLSRGLLKDYYDTISDIVRRYLGGSRGFDAIEMTTDELLARMKQSPLPGVTQVEIERLLSECDLVKFANYTPSHEESDQVLAMAVSLVERGLPLAAPGAKP